MKKPHQPNTTELTKNPIATDDLNRVLAIGAILVSVLTEEELKQLQELPSPAYQAESLQIKIGNTRVT